MTEPSIAHTPRPGFYRVRQAQKGPWVPARIMNEGGVWLVLIAGEPTSPAAMTDPWEVPKMNWVAFSKAITEAEYHAMLTERQKLADDHPLADPTKPTDWRNGRMSEW